MSWYYKLVSKSDDKTKSTPLFSVIKRNRCGVILAKGTMYHGKFCPVFRNFADIVQVSKYLDSLQDSRDIAYHEVILGERPQKLRFDIDLDIEKMKLYGITGTLQNYGNEIVNKLLDAIIDYFSVKWNVTLELMKDILITKSHSKKKYSCHVIVCSKYFMSNNHAREAFKGVIQQGDLHQLVKEAIIDHALFGKTNNFRLLGSLKYVRDPNNRRKVLVTKYSYKGVDYQFKLSKDALIQGDTLTLLKLSMISYVDEATLLDIEIVERKTENIVLHNNEIEQCKDMMRERFGQIYNCNEVSVDSDGIWFNRQLKSDCIMCKRPHESMSALVKILDTNYVFYCGRDFSQHIIIAKSTKRIVNISSHNNEKARLCTSKVLDYDSEDEEAEVIPIEVSEEESREDLIMQHYAELTKPAEPVVPYTPVIENNRGMSNTIDLVDEMLMSIVKQVESKRPNKPVHIKKKQTKPTVTGLTSVVAKGCGLGFGGSSMLRMMRGRA